MNINQLRLKNKKKYLIVNSDKFKTENDFLDAIAQKLNEGIDIIELREQNSTPDKIVRIGKKIRELCSIFNTLFIMTQKPGVSDAFLADNLTLFLFATLKYSISCAIAKIYCACAILKIFTL